MQTLSRVFEWWSVQTVSLILHDDSGLRSPVLLCGVRLCISCDRHNSLVVNSEVCKHTSRTRQTCLCIPTYDLTHLLLVCVCGCVGVWVYVCVGVCVYVCVCMCVCVCVCVCL